MRHSKDEDVTFCVILKLTPTMADFRTLLRAKEGYIGQQVAPGDEVRAKGFDSKGKHAVVR